MKRSVVMIGLAAVALGLASAGYVLTANRSQGGRFRTVTVDRGLIAASVSATGNLNAVITVQVGSQVSGQIKDLYVDFNSPVKAGQLVARLDPDPFQAKVNQAQADVENAQATAGNQRANVEKARADVENARAGVATAEANAAKAQADVENVRAAVATAHANVLRDAATASNAKIQLDRNVDLLRKELVAQQDKDTAQTAFDTAQAQLEASRSQERASQATLRSAAAQLSAAESQVNAARTQVASAQAALQVAQAQLNAAEATVRNKQAVLAQAQLDLDHSKIYAPVNGVVISRAVDVGQTVAASLQAPTLFTIAQDLTRMQVEAAVDEADVGRLRERMPATFTVDAFPGRTFRGNITQIRKNPQIVQNVVTYTTIIGVANPELILMPGMTANVRIVVDRRENVVRVPNAALRYRPPGESAATASSAPPAPQEGGTPGGGQGQLRERLTKELGLSAEQQQRLDTILAASRQAFQGLRAPGTDEAAREAQRRRIRAEIQEKIRAILTPEQRKRYDALAPELGGPGGSAGSPGRVYVLGPDGKLKAVSVVVGLTDGTYSEVLQGELQPGQEVIVGQAPTGPTSGGGAAPTPRLRF
jgi:HlyD family secretion protein